MIWIAAMVLGFVFIKLGMLLILVKFLFLGIKLAVGIITGLVVALLWRNGLLKKPFARSDIAKQK